MNIELLGFVAAFCTTIAFVPQVWLIWKRRSAEGVSTLMYVIFTTGVGLWFLYGLMIHSWPVIVANAITLALACTVLLMKWRFG